MKEKVNTFKLNFRILDTGQREKEQSSLQQHSNMMGVIIRQQKMKDSIQKIRNPKDNCDPFVERSLRNSLSLEVTSNRVSLKYNWSRTVKNK